MKAHIDTDVVIDVVANREPWADDNAAVLDWAKENPMDASIAWHSLANLFYITDISRKFALELVSFAAIPPVDNDSFCMAMRLDLPDPEDAMQVACAMLHEARYIVTRNIRHYRKSPVPAVTPKKFVKIVQAGRI